MLNIYIYILRRRGGGVASGIAESRKSPSTIVNHKTKAIHDDLRSLLRETKTGRYTKRSLDDTRNRKEFTNKNETTRGYERDNTRRGKFQ